jgi:hypothetical protein
MSAQIKDGGPAFPVVTPIDGLGRLAAGYPFPHEGMTLRDYFAAKAVQGICASGPAKSWSDDAIAREAYQIADAMLRAREVKS